MATGTRKRPPTKRPPKPASSTSSHPAVPRPASHASHDDAPEIQVGYAPAGRETIAAITGDLAPAAPDESAPEIEFRLVPAGRETLAAITAEVAAQSPIGVRAPMTTLDRGDRASAPSDEPQTQVRPRLRTRGYSQPPPARTSQPDPRMTMPGVAPPSPGSATPSKAPQKVGRDTLDAIATAVLSEPGAPPSSARVRAAVLDVFELATFVARGEDLAVLSSETVRREFVAERLLHRLPVATMDLVDRIDVTPWTVQGTVILRVWCKVRPPARR